MTNFLSYLADPTDPSMGTPAVDLNGYERGFSPFETNPETFDLGAPELDGVWLSEAGKDEDVLSAGRRGRVASSFDLRLGPGAAGSLGALTGYLRMLNAALDREGVWVVQQPGMADPVFIDYYPSGLVNQLMPGERSLHFLWVQLQQPNGMRVVITRRPKMRGFALSAAVNLAHNATFAEDHNHDGIPTFWSWSDPLAVLLPDEGYDWTWGAHEVLIESTSTLFLSGVTDAGAVTVGSTYTFAVDVAASRTAPATIRARIDWLDSGGAVLATAYSAPVADSALLTPLGGFARPFAVGEAVAGTVTARYGLEVTASSADPLQLWIRCAQLEAGEAPTAFRPGAETVSNDVTQPFGKRLWLWGAGNTDALAAVRIDPDPSAQVVQVSYARRSGARDSAMAMRHAPGWHAVDSTALLSGATDVSGETATVSGHALRSALTNAVLKPMLRHAMTPPDSGALGGTWSIHAAARFALGDAYAVEARYGFGDVSDLPRRASAESVNVDLVHPPAASNYLDLDLGFVRVPPGAPGLWVELWAARATGNPDAVGTGEAYVDQLWLEPADDDVNAVGTLPGIIQPGGTRTETILGKDLDTPPSGYAGPPFVAGSVYNAEMLLNSLNEAAGIPLAMTAGLSAVEHTYVAWLTLYTRLEKTAVKHGDVTVYDLTSSAVVTSVPYSNRKGVAWDYQAVTVRFTPVAGHAYLIWVLDILSTTNGNVRIQKIDHSFTLPDVEPGTAASVLIDASQRQARILEDEQFKANLPLIGAFPTLEPGVQLYRLSLGSLAANGYDGVLDGLTPLRHDPARTALVRTDSIPRWTN